MSILGLRYAWRQRRQEKQDADLDEFLAQRRKYYLLLEAVQEWT